MYGVAKILDVSTLHVEEATLNDSDYKIADYPEGAFFYVADEYDEPSVYPDLKAVFDLARSKGCTLIRFDADGFEYPELPTYDWN